MFKTSASRIVTGALGALFLLTAFTTVGLPSVFTAHADPDDGEVMIDRTFKVAPGDHLVLKLGHSDVHIETGAVDEAHVRVTVDGQNMERARAFFEHLRFEIRHGNGELSVSTNPTRKWNWSRRGRTDVDVTVTIPDVFDVTADVAHGDLAIDDLQGAFRFDLAHGDLSAASMSGPSLYLNMAHGDVDIDNLTSEKTDIGIRHGDLDMGAIAASDIRVETAHGDVDIDYVTAADIAIEASHGDIEVDDLGGFPRIEARHGDIQVRLLQSLGGEFDTAHGDIDVTVPADAALDIDFRGPDVAIDSDVRFERIRVERHALVGRINGGGPRLQARASHGDVSLRTG